MTTSTDRERVLQTERTIPYSADQIYAAFSDPERLAQWWGPEGFKNTFEHFEFKVGGGWKFVMHGPDGRDYPNESRFEELEPGRKVVIRHVCAPYFTLSVSLLPVKAGTQISWAQAFDDPKVAKAVRRIVEPGNEQNLDRLEMLLESDEGA